jgi:hypothetical protein
MILVSIPLNRVNESLFHQDKSGTYLNLLLTPHKDKNGNCIAVQPDASNDRGELDSQCGT